MWLLVIMGFAHDWNSRPRHASFTTTSCVRILRLIGVCRKKRDCLQEVCIFKRCEHFLFMQTLLTLESPATNGPNLRKAFSLLLPNETLT